MSYQEERLPPPGIDEDKCFRPNPRSSEQEPRLALNLVCLCFPSSIAAILFGSEWVGEFVLFGQPMRLDHSLFQAYFLTVPVALLVLIFSRSRRAKVAARRALIGFVLPIIVLSLMPSRAEHTQQRGHP